MVWVSHESSGENIPETSKTFTIVRGTLLAAFNKVRVIGDAGGVHASFKDSHIRRNNDHPKSIKQSLFVSESSDFSKVADMAAFMQENLVGDDSTTMRMVDSVMYFPIGIIQRQWHVDG